MDEKKLQNIEEHLMVIPMMMCRNMDKKFVSDILKDVSNKLAKHHFMILKVLKEDEDNKKIMVREIGDKLGITKSQMTASIDKLIKLGYVEREADLDDRRKIYISITKSGIEITETLSKKVKKHLRKSINLLNENELDELEKGLIALKNFCALANS